MLMIHMIAPGMPARAIGIDKFATRQGSDGFGEVRRFRQWRQINLVDMIEKFIRRHTVHGHQAIKRRAMLGIILLLARTGFVARQMQKPGDEIRHPLVNLSEQIAFCRVERVVEVEHPGVAIL